MHEVKILKTNIVRLYTTELPEICILMLSRRETSYVTVPNYAVKSIFKQQGKAKCVNFHKEEEF